MPARSAAATTRGWTARASSATRSPSTEGEKCVRSSVPADASRAMRAASTPVEWPRAWASSARACSYVDWWTRTSAPRPSSTDARHGVVSNAYATEGPRRTGPRKRDPSRRRPSGRTTGRPSFTSARSGPRGTPAATAPSTSRVPARSGSETRYPKVGTRWARARVSTVNAAGASRGNSSVPPSPSSSTMRTGRPPTPSEPARASVSSSEAMPRGPATVSGRSRPSRPSVPRRPGRPLKWSPCKCVINTASRREKERPARSAATCAPWLAPRPRRRTDLPEARSCGPLQHDGVPAAEARGPALEPRRPGSGNGVRLRAGIEDRAPPSRGKLHLALLLGEEGHDRDLLARAPAPQHQGGTVAPRFERVPAVVLQRGMLAAQREQVPVPEERRAACRGVPVRAVDLAAQERLLVLRVGDLAGPGEGRELLAPTLAHGLHQRRVAVADEVLERLGRGPLLALEEQGERGRERGQRRGDAQAAGRSERGQPLAARAVADLVVVLRRDHEAPAGQVGAGRAVLAAPVPGVRAAVVPARAQRGDQRVERLDRRRREVLVVPGRLAGERDVQRVVEVVRPGPREPVPAPVGRLDQARLVQIALRDHVDRASGRARLALHGVVQ